MLGIPIDKVTRETLLELVEALIGEAGGRILAPVNIDIMNKAHDDPALAQFLRAADVVYSDGAGVVLGSILAGAALPSRVTSIALLWALAQRWADGRHSMYFLGGPPGVAEQARDAILRRHPGVRIVGCHAGHLDTPERQDQALRDVERAAPDVLLVGFGTPIQERFIAAHRQRLQRVPVVWSVGALTSHIAGIQPRAPHLLRRYGMEWLWRLLLEPRRLWRRYLLGNPLFIGRVLKERVLGS